VKVAFVIDAEEDGVGFYESFLLRKLLEEKGVECCRFEEADVVVLERCYKNSAYQRVSRAEGKRFVYWLNDDAFFEDRRFRFAKFFLERCCAVVVPSKEMKERVSGEVKVLGHPVPEVPSLKREKREEVRVGVVASEAWQKGVEHVSHAMVNVARGDEKIKLIWLGCQPRAVKTIPWWRFEYYPYVSPFLYYDAIAALDLDVAVLPSFPPSLERMKRKLLDYGIIRVGVVGNCDCCWKPKSDKLHHWRRALMEMVMDEELRLKSAERLISFVREHEGVIDEWKEFLASL